MEKDKKTIKNSIFDISKEILELENEKNLDRMVKQYNKINYDIKNISSKICALKSSFENDSEILCSNKNEIKGEIKGEIKEEEYQEYMKELSGEEIIKIISCEDLETQIDDYKKLLKKLNSCKGYLDEKKINIIECDKNIEHKEENIKIQNLNLKSKPKPKNKSIAKKSSLNSSSSSSSSSSRSSSKSSKSTSSSNSSK